MTRDVSPPLRDLAFHPRVTVSPQRDLARLWLDDTHVEIEASEYARLARVLGTAPAAHDREELPSSEVTRALMRAGVIGLPGSYRLVRYLDEGSFGTVFECLHRETGTRSALKILHDLTPAAVGDLKNEARTAWALSLPGLVVPRELGFERGRWFGRRSRPGRRPDRWC